MERRLYITPNLCIGCKTCELTCSFSHMKTMFAPGPSCIRVVKTESEPNRYLQMVCLQCQDAACIKTCPVNAISMNEETGAAEINQERCIRCLACVPACPFGNIVVDTSKGTVFKCDLCGGDPLCAKYCPSKALQYVLIERKTQTDSKAA